MGSQSKFRPIPGAPGFSISAEGEILGRRGKPLRTFVPPRCSPSLNIVLNGKKRIHPVWRLLELAWPEQANDSRSDPSFRPIPGTEGYEINQAGEIRSLRRRKPAMLKIHHMPSGDAADLWIDKECRRWRVDKLLSLAWPEIFPPSTKEPDQHGPEEETEAEPERRPGLDMDALRRRVEAAEAIVFRGRRQVQCA